MGHRTTTSRSICSCAYSRSWRRRSGRLTRCSSGILSFIHSLQPILLSSSTIIRRGRCRRRGYRWRRWCNSRRWRGVIFRRRCSSRHRRWRLRIHRTIPPYSNSTQRRRSMNIQTGSSILSFIRSPQSLLLTQPLWLLRLRRSSLIKRWR